ncbi:MAG: hypothetical protein ACYC36_02660 [Bellilinea sp.]
MFTALEPYLIWIKLALVAALAAGAFVAGVHSSKTHYETIIATNQIKTDGLVQAQQAANVKLLADNAALTKAAEVQHASNQSTINALTKRVADLSVVRIHIPTSSSTVCAGTQPGPDQDGASRILSDGVDEGFARLQARVSELVQRCDQLNIDAIKMNASLAGQ